MAPPLDITLNLTTEEQSRLAVRAREQCLSLEAYVQTVIERLVRPVSAQELRLLSREERNRLLAMQAEEAAALYTADLARPVEERELTAFTALDGERVYERTP